MEILEAIKKLRLKNETVPVPMRLPSPVEVDRLEFSIGFQFPEDYKRFLLEASDVVVGRLEPATVSNPKDHVYLPKILEDARSYSVPLDVLPFCEDNADFFCLTKEGRVKFWSHDSGTFTNEEWETLAQWIEEVWLADD